MKKKSVVFCFLNFVVCLVLFSAKAQNISPNIQQKLQAQEDSLILLSDSIYRLSDDIERIAQNGLFVKKLVQSLKTNYSFQYPYQRLNNVSVTQASNKQFRIFSWSLPLNDGTYKYYGAIQMNSKDGTLKLIALSDQSEHIAENEITNQKKWYGARYYDILTVNQQNQTPYYVLLGWKGNSSKTNKKVLEVLSFNKGDAVFGKPVFGTDTKGLYKNRVIFEYSKRNAMSLFYDKKAAMIVFDHLVPLEPKLVGQFEFYGSDSSFDAYAITNGKLELKKDVQLKNEAKPNDDEYLTPTKASSLFKKGKH